MTDEETIKIQVGFEFEIIDFFDYVKEHSTKFDTLMVGFKMSEYYSEEEFPDYGFDFWDWHDFYKRFLSEDYEEMFDQFADSEYPHSHYLTTESEED
jgi:hypothetical protein